MRTLNWIITLCLVAAAVSFAAPRTLKAAPITPGEVYAAVDLLNRSLDVVLRERNMRNIPLPPAPVSREMGLGPFHAYQMHVACIDRLHELEAKTTSRESRSSSAAPCNTSRPTS